MEEKMREALEWVVALPSEDNWRSFRGYPLIEGGALALYDEAHRFIEAFGAGHWSFVRKAQNG